jgi:hypothetical protein
VRAGYGERRFQVSTIKTMLDTASGSANRILVEYCALHPQSAVSEEFRRCGGWSWSSAKHPNAAHYKVHRFLFFFFFSSVI